MTAHFRREFDFHSSYKKIACIMRWKCMLETRAFFSCQWMCSFLEVCSRFRRIMGILCKCKQITRHCTRAATAFTMPSLPIYAIDLINKAWAVILWNSCQKLELHLHSEIYVKCSHEYSNHFVMKYMGEL